MKFHTMNKVVGIGIIIVIIMAIIGVAYSMSSSDTSEDNIPIVVKEAIIEEPESTGTDFSVELTEKIGLKTP